MITNAASRTNVQEIADGIYRINTPIDFPDGQGFCFNQYLLVDDAPMLFHTGPRRLFPVVSEAIAAIIPLDRLRYVGFSHVEADECGAIDPLLASAPQAVPLCGRIAAMVWIGDMVDREPRVMADGESISLGRHSVTWFDTPHVPHGWDCGQMLDSVTATLFCSDLLTQPGHGDLPLTNADILEPSEAFRQAMEYFAHAPHTAATLLRLAEHAPRTLACMHGSAWEGDGAALLRALALRLEAKR